MAQELEARLVANTTGFQAGMRDAATVAERETKKIQQYAKDVAKYLKQQEEAAKAAAAPQAYRQMAENAEKVRHSSAGVNRELLVLAHEMSQGNYSRFGGSLMVLAERTNALEFAMSGAGAALLGVGAAVVGIAAAFAAGAIESEKFGKALKLTGNYAAATEESISELAKAQHAATGQGIAGARSSVEAVAGSGLFGPAAVASVARAMGDYQKLTDESAEDALKMFAKLQDGVAKWAAEQNHQMHFLTLGQFEHIKALEDAGKKEEAMIETVKALSSALESRGTPALGYFARAWDAVKDAAGSAIDSMKDWGRPVDPLVAGIAKVDQQMALVRQANTANPGAAADTLAALAAERTRLSQQLFRADEHRTDAAASAAAAAAAIDKAEKRKKVEIPFAKPESAEESFRLQELQQEQSVMEALHQANLKDLEDKNKQFEILANIRDLDTAGETFRQQELAQQEQVNAALREQQQIQDEINRQAEHNASFTNGISDAMNDYVKNAENAAKSGREFFDDAARGMTDSIVQFAETGKLSFKGLVSSMINDLIKFQAEQAISGLFKAGSNGLGAAMNVAGTAFANAIDFFPTFANGLDYVPYDGFPAVLHEGESVVRKQDAALARSGGHGSVVDASIGNISVGQGVSRAEVFAAVSQAQAQTEARMRRLMRTGSMA
jgi:lambda family phage tail tape measure protein